MVKLQPQQSLHQLLRQPQVTIFAIGIISFCLHLFGCKSVLVKTVRLRLTLYFLLLILGVELIVNVSNITPDGSIVSWNSIPGKQN